MPRTYTLCPHHGSFHHTNTASGQVLSLHFYCFVKTHPGNPHTLGPRASLQETSSFHRPKQRRRGVLSEPQVSLTSPDLREVLSVRFTKPMIPQLLSDSRQKSDSKRTRIRPRRPGGKESARLKAAPASAGPRFAVYQPRTAIAIQLESSPSGLLCGSQTARRLR